jgi:hypothetical protein
MQGLRHFSFCNSLQAWDCQDFVAACLDKSSFLETLILHNDIMIEDDHEVDDIGATLGPKARPSLTYLDLRTAAFRFPHFDRLIKQLPNSMRHIALQKVLLYPDSKGGGTWEDALDLLRTKTCPSWFLREPWEPDISYEESMLYELFREDDEPSPNLPEKYVANIHPEEPNPVRAMMRTSQQLGLED